MTTIYRRTSSCECEDLEGEFVVMERDSQAVVTLNPAGRLVWEAIDEPVSLDEIEAAFRDVFPNLGAQTIRHDIKHVLDALVTAGLVFIEAED